MKKELVIYPCYFDQKLKRSEGRRVPKDLAVPSPDLNSIVSAVKKAGLNPVVEDKSHPAFWLDKKGRVRVRYLGPKEELLKKIAAGIGAK